MTANIHFHDSVITSDGTELGVAQRIFRTSEDDPMETGIYFEHLMVVNMHTGEDFFVPLQFVSARTDGGVALSITYQEVLNNSFDNEPRYIAYHSGTKQNLPA